MYQELAVEQIALLTLGAEMLFLLFAAPYYLVSLIRALIGAANRHFIFWMHPQPPKSSLPSVLRGLRCLLDEVRHADTGVS